MIAPLAAALLATVLSTLIGQHLLLTCAAALLAAWVAAPEEGWR